MLIKESVLRDIIRQELIKENVKLANIGTPILAAMLAYSGLMYSNNQALKDEGRNQIEQIVQATSDENVSVKTKKELVRNIYHQLRTLKSINTRKIILSPLRQNSKYQYEEGTQQYTAAQELLMSMLAISSFYQDNEQREIYLTLLGENSLTDILENSLKKINDAFEGNAFEKDDIRNIALGIIRAINNNEAINTNDLNIMSPKNIEALNFLEGVKMSDHIHEMAIKIAQTQNRYRWASAIKK